MSTPPPFDVLTATIKDLQVLLVENKCTSVDLIEIYLDAIEKNNRDGLKLYAVIETAPKEQLLQIAREMDEQRSAGKPFGPLHGIPILVKDNLGTEPSLGMKTTAGSYALEDSVVKQDASVIKLLRDNGAIILGKANMTEWANFRQENPYTPGSDEWKGAIHHGWSGRGGPCTSPYNPERTALGSSTGSAVAVAAGFAPASIGSETFGSICMPADRTGLYSIKPTVGLISSAGGIPLTSTRDVFGPMTKNAYDSALLLQVLAGPDERDANTKRSPFKKGEIDYVKLTENPSFEGKKIGIYPLSPEDLASEAETVFIEDLMLNTVTKLRENGATVIDDMQELDFDTESFGKKDNLVLLTDFKVDLANYLGTLEKTSVKSLADVIQFNIDHKDIEMPPRYPGQSLFLKAQATKGKDDPEYIEALSEIERIANERLEAMFEENQLDAIFLTRACSDRDPIWLASPAKYPIVTVPLGFDETIQEPVCLFMIGRPFSEATLVQLMAAWEVAFPPRRVPSALETTGK